MKRTLLLSAALLIGLHPAQAADPCVLEVGSVAMTVADAQRSAEFFHDVLDFEQIADNEAYGPAYEQLLGVFGARLRVIRMALGDERLALIEFVTPRGRPIPADAKSNDLTFQHIAIVVADMDAAYRRLREHHVQHVSTAPQRLPDSNPAAGGIEAFYFRDPDGHNLELIHFPSGKGDPRWQDPAGRLFLGIDHTAIAVSDTDASLRLYRDVFGMRVAGTSDNHGDEQAHLNLVEGAHLRITGLRAARGPGIELLEYLEPRGGRTAPTDLQPNDLQHWHIELRASDPGELLTRCRATGVNAAAPLVELPQGIFAGGHASLLRDRDRHALLLLAP